MYLIDICFFTYSVAQSSNPFSLHVLFILCHAYRLSPSYQMSRTIFDNPISLKWREEIKREGERERDTCHQFLQYFILYLKVDNRDTRRNVYLLWQAGINYLFFPNITINLHFCSTLALIAIPRPTALGLQTGGHGRANRTV